jgi:hypothetical protein
MVGELVCDVQLEEQHPKLPEGDLKKKEAE